ncbi:DUF5667 domain-containing protein [Patescibacteria group bacterium]
MFKKISLLLLIFTMTLGLSCSAVIAQDVVEIDEELEVGAEELDIEEPGSFYWFKNLGWSIQAFLTRDPVKKSEILLKKSSFQLLRARQLVKNDPDDDELQEKLDAINEKYKTLIDDINSRIEKFKTDNPEDLHVKNFLEKYTNQQIRHQEILGRLEERVPEAVMERIRVNREEHLEKFGEVMNKLQNKEELKQSLQNALGGVGEKIERKARRMNIIEEVGEEVSEIKEKIEEFRQEQPEAIKQQLKIEWKELQDKKGVIKDAILEKVRERKMNDR